MPQTTRLAMRTPRRRATTAPRAALTVNAAAPSSMPLALAIASAWPFAATMTVRFARATEGAAENRPAKRFGLRISETRANATTKRPPLAALRPSRAAAFIVGAGEPGGSTAGALIPPRVPALMQSFVLRILDEFLDAFLGDLADALRHVAEGLEANLLHDRLRLVGDGVDALSHGRLHPAGDD